MTRLDIGSSFPQEFPGGTFNRLVGLLEDANQSGGSEQLAQLVGLLAASDPVGMVIHVVNKTGEDLVENAIGIVKGDSFAIDPPDIGTEEDEDKADEVVLGGVQVEIEAPTDENEGDFYVITIDPLFKFETGRAYLPNAAWARIDIQDEEDKTAGPQDGDTKYLKSGTGSTPILVKPAGTGKKWCIVLLGGGGRGAKATIENALALIKGTVPAASGFDTTGDLIDNCDLLIGKRVLRFGLLLSDPLQSETPITTFSEGALILTIRDNEFFSGNQQFGIEDHARGRATLEKVGGECSAVLADVINPSMTDFIGEDEGVSTMGYLVTIPGRKFFVLPAFDLRSIPGFVYAEAQWPLHQRNARDFVHIGNFTYTADQSPGHDASGTTQWQDDGAC